jgi:hypothetical protein
MNFQADPNQLGLLDKPASSQIFQKQKFLEAKDEMRL